VSVEEPPGEACPTGKSVEIFLASPHFVSARDGRDRVREKTVLFGRFNLIWVVQWSRKKYSALP
jgi:hypothetical protein